MQDKFSAQQEQSDVEEFKIRQTYCIEHPQNYIINFCKNPTCLMPLCKECIKLHALEHYQKGTQPEFDIIDTVVIETYQQIEALWQKYQQHKEAHQEYQKKLTNHKNVLKQQFTIAKDKIIHIVEKYFQTLWEQTEQKENLCFGLQQQVLTKQMDFLLQKSSQMEQYLNKLNSDNFLKYIILILNSSEAIEEDIFAKDSNATLEKFLSELMDVTIGESVLKQIKSNLYEYVNIPNANLYDQPKKQKEAHQQQAISAPQNLTQKFNSYASSQQNSLYNSQQKIPSINNIQQPYIQQYNQNATSILRQSQQKQQSVYIKPQQQQSLNVFNSQLLHQRMPSQGMPMPMEILQQQQQFSGIKSNNYSIQQNNIPNISNQRASYQFKF